jgi:murein DD-endopeptidase MepM/ murein hydrolase activator NlpD
MRHWQILLWMVVSLFWGIKGADAQDILRVEWKPKIIQQGGVSLLQAFAATSLQSIYGEFQGKRIPLAMGAQEGTYEGLIGIDLDGQPGAYKVKITATSGDRRVYSRIFSVEVKKVDFGIQRLTLPSSMVDLDRKTLDRVNREARRLQALFQGFRDERLWKGAFIRPLTGEITSPFGLRRVINKQPRSSHSGVDIKAPQGTPVKACNGGLVVLVDQLFFSGKSVILDHGGGIFSMYFHLAETHVQEGDRVNKGDVLGRVGSTGRSTAPHLHWGVKINGARVDPLALIRSTEHLGN